MELELPVFRAYRGAEPPRFASPAELECAKVLDYYDVAWEYEPRTFVLEEDEDGRVSEAFTPDFFLPDQNLYVEIEVLEHADLLVPAHARAPVAGKLDEVERMENRHGSAQIGDEDEARLERRHQHRLAAGVVVCDLGAELLHARSDLGRGEGDLTDPVVRRPVAGISWRG